MKQFTENKILAESETVGQKLSQARAEKKIALEQAAKDLKINIKYLQALEDGQLKKLPAGVYAQNYLRAYADYLRLDSKELLAQQSAEKEGPSVGWGRKLFVQKTTKAKYFLSIPKLLKNLLIIGIIAACVVYIGFYINNIIAPPTLTISAPAEDITISERKLSIIGKTEKNASVDINGKEILTGEHGEISYELELKMGLNAIIIQAQKKYSRKNIIIRNILVE